jgi:hypothetical protein
MEKVLQVFANGDFDMPYAIAVCTDTAIAEKLIKKHANRFRKVTIVNTSINKFKIKENNNGESYDYWIKEIKLNTLL